MAKARTNETGAVLAAGAQGERPGVYACRLDGCPRQLVETGLPAGPEAEAVAKDRYLAGLKLGLRHKDGVKVTLEA